MLRLIHIIIASSHPVTPWLKELLFADYTLPQLSLCLSTRSGRRTRSTQPRRSAVQLISKVGFINHRR